MTSGYVGIRAQPGAISQACAQGQRLERGLGTRVPEAVLASTITKPGGFCPSEGT